MASTYPSPSQLATPTVGASSVQVAGANLSRIGLFVFNPSSTVTLWVSPTGTNATTTGSVAIEPLQGVMFGPPNTPNWTAGMNAIASSGGSNAIVIFEYTQ